MINYIPIYYCWYKFCEVLKILKKGGEEKVKAEDILTLM